MTREEKAAKVKEIEEVLSGAKGIYLADFRSMTVEAMTELRKRCRESEIRFEVVKNTLLRRAAESTGNAGLVGMADGPTAIATSEVDEIAPARVLREFLKEFKLPVMKGGVVGERAYDGKQVRELAKLPSREVILGNLLRVLQAPLSGFASVLQAPLRNLANVLEQVSKQKESAA